MVRKNLSNKDKELLDTYGIPPIDNGARPYDETAIVNEFINGYINGTYKNFSHGAKILAQKTPYKKAVPEHIEERLMRTFSRAWKAYSSRK